MIDIEEIHHDNHDMLDKSMKREPLKKRRRVSKEGKQPKFTWCQSRQQMVVKEAISEELFSKVESCHSEVAQIIYETCCDLDDVFCQTNAEDVLSMIYSIQRKVSGVRDSKINTLKGFEQDLRENLKRYDVLEEAFYLHSSTSLVYTLFQFCQTKRQVSVLSPVSVTKL